MAEVLVYVTTQSHDQALAISRRVVGEGLAACANILGGILSVYRWEGVVREEEEVALLLKTRRDLVDVLSERIRTLHTYDCPCVVAFDISGGNHAFLDWISAQCGGGSSG